MSMKKSFIFALLLLLPLTVFAQSYKIVDAEYDVKGNGFKFLGKTREFPLKSQFPLDKKTVFTDNAALEKYINNYKQTLISSRSFDEVEVEYDAVPSENPDIYNVVLKVFLQDSRHLIIMPYPKYSSNSGVSLKLKAKDSNFLGSLNTMNTEINLRYNKGDGFKPSFSFDFDYPFKMGPFNATFINDYSISYVLDDDNSGIEWDTKTGLSMSHSFGKVGINFGFYQYTYKDIDYKDYGDEYYFKEAFNFGLGFTLATLPNFTTISYGPSFGVSYNWDPDGLNPANDGLATPEFSFSHGISNGKVTWNDKMRKGYNVSLGNSFSYNLQRKDLVPYASFDAQFFWNWQTNEDAVWNRLGLCTNFISFHYFNMESNSRNYGRSIGDYLRGILDDNYFGNSDSSGTASTAMILNLDLPVRVFTAYFPELPILSFDFQFSPFVDMALVYNDQTKRWFAFEDGYYTAGIEALVYPLKWSSVTVRASIGVDLRRNIFVEGLKKNKEIFIGLGLQY